MLRAFLLSTAIVATAAIGLPRIAGIGTSNTAPPSCSAAHAPPCGRDRSCPPGLACLPHYKTNLCLPARCPALR